MLSPAPPRVLIQFPYWLFKQCAAQLTPVITHLFNRSLATSVIPASWKHCIVTPKPKVNGTLLSRSMTSGQYQSRLFCPESLNDSLSDSITCHQYQSTCYLTNLSSVPMVQLQLAMFSIIQPDSLPTINLYGVFWSTSPKLSIPYPIQFSWKNLKHMAALLMLSAGLLVTSQTAHSQYQLLLVQLLHFPSLAA